jgi:hypothetical protein
LGLQVARFATGAAIVNAVFAQADLKQALAQRAVFVAGAASFRLVADHAHKFLGHSGRLARFGGSGNGTMVDGPAVIAALPRTPSRLKSSWNQHQLKEGTSIVVKEGTFLMWYDKQASFIDPAKRGC